MLPTEPQTLDPELEECILHLFEASERVYASSLQELAAGRTLQSDEETPSAIAFSVAMHAIKHGLPCPNWAAKVVAHDWKRFRDFKCTSLGDAFGIPDHKHRAAKHDELLCAAVYSEVRELQSKNVPLKDNAKGGKGALSQVGERHHMSGKKIEALMKKWKDICKKTGSDPDAKPTYADPLPLIAAVFSSALSGNRRTS